ncbi:hypothetical protein NLJ89_g12019 [Agrocybe chaxingu]|uniref:Methyltransferase domain-containing protein n=1 Tax=Agrocybe chaxingu TaxID=84603 RepID=A0A9W8JRC2_9AGAR|nr:hypothetical protein NLJ89_g12019 [Agrocybe chaxingu]
MPSIPSVLSSPTPASSLASPVSNSSGSSNGYDGSRGGVGIAPSQTFSETASAFSDDSSDLSLRRTKSSTSSNPSGTPAPFVFPSSRSRAAPNKPASFKMKSLAGRRSRKSSNASGDADSVDERKRFMGILLKKKKKQLKEIDPSTPSADSGFSSGDNDSSSHSGTGSIPDAGEGGARYEENQEALHAQSRERARRIKSRIGSYPLDPYDSVLLDNDRHTGELLTRLNPMGSPTFHNYGNSPPTSVLDLGCGQGHWVIDAAIAWRGYGTKVTGYDMVDISKGLLPWAVEQGVTDSIRFVRGNFLKQRLPFSDNSFDLVRMSCLALCITSDSWIFVLQEVCRVLMVGGRLELIDDLIFFPYGKSFSGIDDLPSTTSPIESVAPRLDITIPSSAFTTFSIYDGDTTNPGLGFIEEPPDQDEFYELDD